VKLLNSPEADVREQAVWALGNIAGDSPDMRDYVLSCGALPPLLNLLSDTRKVSMVRNATWTLSNFCRGKNPQPDWNLIHPALPMLAKLIYSLDDEVLIDACWAISYLSDGANEKIQAVIEAGVPRRLVELLMHSHTAVRPRLNKLIEGPDSSPPISRQHCHWKRHPNSSHYQLWCSSGFIESSL
jgi:hypothetical protein